MKRQFTEKVYIWLVNMKRWARLLITRKMQIETTLSYLFYNQMKTEAKALLLSMWEMFSHISARR